jgi:hypothetical protein
MLILASLIALLWVLALPSDALAWGPATHVFLSSSLLAGASGLGPALLAFLRRHRKDFYEGSVWADVLLAKKYADRGLHSHSWSMGHSLLDRADSDRQWAFALGYLGHLAADTVAHGHYIPRKLLLSRLPENLGHFYWELRADGLLDRTWWDQVEFRVSGVSSENRELLRDVLEPTVFSFQTNRFLFEGQLASYRLDRWYRLMALAERWARMPIRGNRMEIYHEESLARMSMILKDPFDATLLSLDPTGGARLRWSVETRRELRRLIRSGTLGGETLYSVAHELMSNLRLGS